MPPKDSGKKGGKKDGKKPAPAKSAAAKPKVNVDRAQALREEIQAERAQKDGVCASEMESQAIENITKNTGADEAESSKPYDKLGDKPGEDEAAPLKPAGKKVTPEEKRKRHLGDRMWAKWMGLYQEDSNKEDGVYDRDSAVNLIPEETKKWGKGNGGKKKKKAVVIESESEIESDEDDTEDDEVVDTGTGTGKGKEKGIGKGEGKKSAKAKKPVKRASPDNDDETDKSDNPLPKKPKTTAEPASVAKPKATSKSTAGGSKTAKGKTNKDNNPGDEPGEHELPAAGGIKKTHATKMGTPASTPAGDPAREGKCKAIIVTTEKPCLSKARPSSEYCGVHKSQDTTNASPPNRATKGKGHKK